MITLYDFVTNFPNKSASQYTWRVRLALNYKGLEHQTVWFGYADIEQRSKELGIPPGGLRPDGSPRYTVPAIHDSSTNTYVSDSIQIIEYLDKAYPETPQLTVPGTEVLVAAFAASLPTTRGALWPIFAPTVIANLQGKHARKYQDAFEQKVGMTPEEFKDKEDLQEQIWKKAEQAFGEIDGYLKKSTDSNEDGSSWIMGAKPTISDFVLASGLFGLVTILGEDSKEWKRVAGWNEGRWGRLWAQSKLYGSVS